MAQTLSVSLAGRRVGAITNFPGDYNLFAFDDEYLEDPSAPILTQGLIGPDGHPLRIVPRKHRVAPPFFANLLPEEGSVLRTMLARQHAVNVTRDFPLLRALGGDLPGAVEIGGMDADTEHHAAGASTSAERHHAAEPLRFSLAGVQLKFSASAVANRLTIPLDGLGGSWIVKLPTNAFRRLPENEFAMMSLAAHIGLDVPEIRLVELADIEGLPADIPALRSDEPRLAYAISRFDRLRGGARVHVEDFNQIADQPPGEKYEHKATQWIASTLQALAPEDDFDQFVRRLVFGVCIGNNDMHLKNWAIRYPDGRRARIAPMYDYVCTKLYYPNGPLALRIGGRREFEQIDRLALREFAEVAEVSGITRAEARRRDRSRRSRGLAELPGRGSRSGARSCVGTPLSNRPAHERPLKTPVRAPIRDRMRAPSSVKEQAPARTANVDDREEQLHPGHAVRPRAGHRTRGTVLH